MNVLQVSLMTLKLFLKPIGLLKAVVRRYTVKKVFLEITQKSQENTCARDCFLVKLQA